jgi:hypothetical protein
MREIFPHIINKLIHFIKSFTPSSALQLAVDVLVEPIGRLTT